MYRVPINTCLSDLHGHSHATILFGTMNTRLLLDFFATRATSLSLHSLMAHILTAFVVKRKDKKPKRGPRIVLPHCTGGIV